MSAGGGGDVPELAPDGVGEIAQCYIQVPYFYENVADRHWEQALVLPPANPRASDNYQSDSAVRRFGVPTTRWHSLHIAEEQWRRTDPRSRIDVVRSHPAADQQVVAAQLGIAWPFEHAIQQGSRVVCYAGLTLTSSRGGVAKVPSSYHPGTFLSPDGVIHSDVRQSRSRVSVSSFVRQMKKGGLSLDPGWAVFVLDEVRTMTGYTIYVWRFAGPAYEISIYVQSNVPGTPPGSLTVMRYTASSFNSLAGRTMRDPRTTFGEEEAPTAFLDSLAPPGSVKLVDPLRVVEQTKMSLKVAPTRRELAAMDERHSDMLEASHASLAASMSSVGQNFVTRGVPQYGIPGSRFGRTLSGLSSLLKITGWDKGAEGLLGASREIVSWLSTTYGDTGIPSFNSRRHRLIHVLYTAANDSSPTEAMWRAWDTAEDKPLARMQEAVACMLHIGHLCQAETARELTYAGAVLQGVNSATLSGLHEQLRTWVAVMAADDSGRDESAADYVVVYAPSLVTGELSAAVQANRIPDYDASGCVVPSMSITRRKQCTWNPRSRTAMHGKVPKKDVVFTYFQTAQWQTSDILVFNDDLVEGEVELTTTVSLHPHVVTSIHNQGAGPGGGGVLTAGKAVVPHKGLVYFTKDVAHPEAAPSFFVRLRVPDGNKHVTLFRPLSVSRSNSVDVADLSAMFALHAGYFFAGSWSCASRSLPQPPYCVTAKLPPSTQLEFFEQIPGSAHKPRTVMLAVAMVLWDAGKLLSVTANPLLRLVCLPPGKLIANPGGIPQAKEFVSDDLRDADRDPICQVASILLLIQFLHGWPEAWGLGRFEVPSLSKPLQDAMWFALASAEKWFRMALPATARLRHWKTEELFLLDFLQPTVAVTTVNEDGTSRVEVLLNPLDQGHNVLLELIPRRMPRPPVGPMGRKRPEVLQWPGVLFGRRHHPFGIVAAVNPDGREPPLPRAELTDEEGRYVSVSGEAVALNQGASLWIPPARVVGPITTRSSRVFLDLTARGSVAFSEMMPDPDDYPHPPPAAGMDNVSGQFWSLVEGLFGAVSYDDLTDDKDGFAEAISTLYSHVTIAESQAGLHPNYVVVMESVSALLNGTSVDTSLPPGMLGPVTTVGSRIIEALKAVVAHMNDYSLVDRAERLAEELDTLFEDPQEPEAE